VSSAGEAKTAKRRPAGEPRRLLLSAAADVFNRKDYSGATTREIAEHANVGENQIFRFFGSKAGLFNEAMVVPFVELVDRHIERRLADPERFDHPRQAARTFIADMYDTFHTHRALATALFTADVMKESGLAEAGVLDEVRRQIERLVVFGTEEARLHGARVPEDTHAMATVALLALVAGMSILGDTYLDGPMNRDTIVDEITDWHINRYVIDP
jgi:AcrR family transcriptional regulator